jgi:hypothetical protein
MKKILFIIIALLIAFMLFICYCDTMFMYGISAPVSNTQLGVLPITLSVIFFFAFCVISFMSIKKKKSKILLMSGLFVCWLFVGRVVGYNVWENSIVGGWHNLIKTKEIVIGENNQSQIGNEIRYTHITKLSFWRLRIENKKVTTTLYVGPFIWQEALNLFQSEGFNMQEIATATL